jgi:hypothetical protein
VAASFLGAALGAVWGARSIERFTRSVAGVVNWRRLALAGQRWDSFMEIDVGVVRRVWQFIEQPDQWKTPPITGQRLERVTSSLHIPKSLRHARGKRIRAAT